MKYLAAILLSALLTADGVVIATTGATLPARVASHFTMEGYANGFMARSDYLLLMMALGLGIPILAVIVTVLLPSLAPSRLRIPSRDYWIAPERRSQTLSAITTAGMTMACVLAVFMIAVHLLVVQANSRTPPQMDNSLLFTFIALLIVAMLFWQFLMWRRFQVPQ